MDPKISVIVPVYNTAPYLHQCLDSIVSQTLKDIEIICIDDGSTDNSLKILEEYASKDMRITILQQKNAGSGVARNNGITQSHGTYIAFMDADDYYPSADVLETLFTTAINNRALICGGNVMIVDESPKIFPLRKSQLQFNTYGLCRYSDYQCSWWYWRYIFNRKFLYDKGLTFPNYRRGQDPPFFVNAMIAAETYYTIDKMTYCYRTGHKKIKWNVINANDYLLSLVDLLHISDEQDLYILKNTTKYEYMHHYITMIIHKLDKSNDDFTDLIHHANELLTRSKIGYKEQMTNYYLSFGFSIFIRYATGNRVERMMACMVSLIIYIKYWLVEMSTIKL